MTETVQIGLIGPGVRGAQVLEALASRHDVILERIGRDVRIDAVGLEIEGEVIPLAAAGRIIEDPGIEVVVDITTTEEPARTLIEEALARGKHVVTSNHEVVARHGNRLAARAEAGNASLRYSAAASSVVPALDLLRSGSTGDPLTRLDAVLDGTASFVVDHMVRRGSSFVEARGEASRRGYSWAGADEDLGVRASACRLAILASAMLGGSIAPEEVVIRTLDRLEPSDLHHMRQFGYELRLIATAYIAGSAVRAAVLPTLLPQTHALARSGGTSERMTVVAELGDTITLEGTASGVGVTVVRLLDDVCSTLAGLPGPRPGSLRELRTLGPRDFPSAAYLRLDVHDPGPAETKVTTLLNDRGIDVLLAAPRRGSEACELVVLTGPATVGALDEVAVALVAEPSVAEVRTRMYIPVD